MARDLKYKISIVYKGIVLAEQEVDSNEMILDLIREREYNIVTTIGNIASNLVPLAVKKYDEIKLNPPENGDPISQ